MREIGSNLQLKTIELPEI
jgi:hypothetical protein